MEGGEELVLGDAELFEDLGGEKEVLDAEILVLELFGGLSGAAEKGLEARGDVEAAAGGAGAGNFGEAGDFGFYSIGELGGLGAKFFQQAGDEAVLLGGEGVEEVFDLDGLVTLLGGLGLGRGDSFLGVFGELVQIHGRELSERSLRRARRIEARKDNVEAGIFRECEGERER